jgi:hypothetical protein
MALLSVTIDYNNDEGAFNVVDGTPEDIADIFSEQFGPFEQIREEESDEYCYRRIKVSGPKGKFLIVADLIGSGEDNDDDDEPDIVACEVEIFNDGEPSSDRWSLPRPPEARDARDDLSFSESKAVIESRFPDRASAERHVAGLKSSGKNPGRTKIVPHRGEYVIMPGKKSEPKARPFVSDRDKRAARLKKAGVQDVIGALADEYHGDPVFVRDVIGDYLYDQCGGNDKLMAEVAKKLISTGSSSVKRAARQILRDLGSPAAPEAFDGRVDAIAARVIRHVDNAAGDMAYGG